MGMNVVPQSVAAVIKELVRLESARQRQIMLFRCVYASLGRTFGWNIQRCNMAFSSCSKTFVRNNCHLET